MKTDTGEVTIKAKEIVILSKALRPLPDKYHGLTNVEQRYRQRYWIWSVIKKVLIVSWNEAKSSAKFVVTLTVMGISKSKRQYCIIKHGAAARPFITHHNALDMDLYLRIALELHLKTIDRGRHGKSLWDRPRFRNEGIDTTHNPEFTMLEAYTAYTDFKDVMDLTEGIIRNAVEKSCTQQRSNTMDKK